MSKQYLTTKYKNCSFYDMTYIYITFSYYLFLLNLLFFVTSHPFSFLHKLYPKYITAARVCHIDKKIYDYIINM